MVAMDGNLPMLTYDDCVALSQLSAEEIAVIAAHEHCPEIIAVELGAYLLRMPNGAARISRFIRDDIDAAVQAADHAESARLKLVLQHFLKCHGNDQAPAAPAGTVRL